MPRYFIELSYKGTAYSGFQVQENAHTVQAELERAMHVLFRQQFTLTGSSRTDAGVHADQNFFHFDTDTQIGQRHVYNLNALLPQDVAVKGIYMVPDDAHCRFSAEAREYRYFIYTHKNPFLTDRGWLYPYPLDIGRLQAAAAVLKEYEDFTSFSKRNTQAHTKMCSIMTSEWTRMEQGFVYTVKANRFLRGMVRGLVGTMLKVGRDQWVMDDFRAAIEAKDCSRADFSTPAQGLFLHRVHFPEPLNALLNV